LGTHLAYRTLRTGYALNALRANRTLGSGSSLYSLRSLRPDRAYWTCGALWSLRAGIALGSRFCAGNPCP
jgi:hypothetical protein